MPPLSQQWCYLTVKETQRVVHPKTYKEFERICGSRNAGGRILEVGAVPATESLLCMSCLRDATEKIGVNLDGPHKFQDFQILRANANDMSCFNDGYFDVVLSNAVLEHDKFFWKTIAEIRRVTKPGGLIVIGTPGYTQFPVRPFWAKMRRTFIKLVGRVRLLEPLYWLLRSTPTIEIHDAPGDYYRFTAQTFKDMFFEGMVDVDIHTMLMPPIIIGAGIKPK